MYATRNDVAECMKDYPESKSALPSEVKSEDGYSDPLYGILGARNLQTVDVSDYEKASLIHDMNIPVPQSWHQKYSCVIDSGTLEHVFNFPVAIRNCMDMLKPGGHFIGITPANNQMGHGFYQFSPELYFRVFSPANGFEMVKMLIPVGEKGKTDWYEVSDPATVKSRVMLVNSIPLSLMFIARKVEHKEVFASIPQQSDYTVIWKKSDDQKPGSEHVPQGVTDSIKGMLPVWIKDAGKKIIAFITRKNVRVEGLGVIDKSHFRKVSI
jgi:SAM-dependent methyltransferase